MQQLVFYESDAKEQTLPVIVNGTIKPIVTAKEGARKMTVLYLRISKGGMVKEHFHESEEVFYVQSGEADVTIDGNVHHVRKGAVVFVPSNAKHETHNSGSEPLTFLAVTSPPRDPPPPV
jgi:quercetin dioxygenase-like cupin family protein